MAISRKRAKNGNVYITYSYRDGKRTINIYCGIEGSERAQSKLQAAKENYRKLLLKRAAEKTS